MLACTLAGSLPIVEAGDPILGEIRVEAKEQALDNEPVSVSLPQTGFDLNAVHLVDPTGQRSEPIPAQIERNAEQGDRLWFLLPGKIEANKSRTFQLKADTAKVKQQVTIKDTGKAYQIRIGDRPVLNYNHQHIPAPDSLDPLYGRSAHIHPIWTPSGKIVSDEFPPDHAHQSGQFLAYTKAKFEGRATNFWEIKSKKGRVRFHKLISQQEGPVFAELKVEQEHVDLTGKKEQPALWETWTIRVWNHPGKAPGFWMYDIISEARCGTESTLHLPEYHYGGMAIRGGRGWTKEKCQFLTANGKTRENGNHDRANWCDISGTTNPDSGWSGFTILTSPENFRYPEPVRIHPSMPYMVFTPSPLGDWKIEPGKPNVSRYRFLAHDGLPLANTDLIWQNYAHPPAASLTLKTTPN